MSAWTEFACLQYLSSELNQRLLEVSPAACLSVSPSGSLGFSLGILAGAFVVWWFIQGLSSSILIYYSILLLLIFKTTITVLPLRCGNLRDSCLARCDGTSLWTVFPSFYSYVYG